MCKLDIEKTYDYLKCAFLLNILRQIEFGERRLKWIGLCIKTIRLSVLVNGELVGFSLREGSYTRLPFLSFPIHHCHGRFNNMTRSAISNRWIKGFKDGNRIRVDMEIFHMLYANNIVMFCEYVVEQICYTRIVLIVFEDISSFSIDRRNSNLYPIKEVVLIEELTRRDLWVSGRKITNNLFGHAIRQQTGRTHDEDVEMDVWAY